MTFDAVGTFGFDLVLVGFVVLIVHLAQGSGRRRLSSPEAALQAFQIERPELNILELDVTRDGRAAMALSADGRLTALTAIGQHWFIRSLEAPALIAAHCHGSALEVRLNDSATPPLRFDFGDRHVAATWWTRTAAVLNESHP